MSKEPNPKPVIGLTCRWDEENDWNYLPSEYAASVAAAGGVPVLIPLIPGTAAQVAARLDAILLCGSPSDVDPARYGQARHAEVKKVYTARDETDYRVLEVAFRAKKPILGICFGMQLLNVYLGGTLIQHIPESVPGALEHKDRKTEHPIAIEPGSRIAAWSGGAAETIVNSTHHQSVQKAGQGMRVTARAPDGVVEAVEGDFPGHFVIGVQWHPERIWGKEKLSARVFSELVQAALEQFSTAKKQAESAIR